MTSDLFLPCHVANVDWFLVELSHENDSCCSPALCVHTYWPTFGPLGKMLWYDNNNTMILSDRFKKKKKKSQQYDKRLHV